MCTLVLPLPPCGVLSLKGAEISPFFKGSTRSATKGGGVKTSLHYL
ncbi:MAG: hypothetical protein Q8S84_07690 [bacterium]|nr:hypothetical protein [bacterium]MDP3381325.1 hypothetical protein [bacterium]